MQSSRSTLLTGSVKSTSEISSQTDKRMTSFGTNWYFPLFEQMTSSIYLPNICYLVLICFITLQSIYVSMWTNRNPVWNDEAKGSINIISIICGFCPSTEVLTEGTILITFIVFLVVFIFCFMFLILQILWFKNFRRFNAISLYPTRFLFEIIPALMLFPVLNLSSMLIDKIIKKENQTKDVVIVVILLIIFAFFLFFFINTTNLLGISAYIQQNCFDSFCTSPYIFFMFCNTLFNFFFNIFSVFSLYVRFFVVLGDTIILVILLVKFTYRPFISQVMNGLFMTLIVYQIIMNVFYLVTLIMKVESKSLYGYGILGISFVVGIIFSSVFTNVQTKQINSVLDGKNKENVDNNVIVDTSSTSDDKPSNKNFPVPTINNNNISNGGEGSFTYLGIERSEKKAILFLEFIVSHSKVEFLHNLQIFTYVLSLYNNVETTLRLLRLLTWFPSETRIVSLVLRNLMQKKKFSSKQRFLVYQVQRIKTFRLSTSSNSAADRIHELRQTTRDLESMEKAFWSQSITKIGYLDSVSREIRKADAFWEESMNEFPNSTFFGEEKIRFYIECKTNFTLAIKEKHNVDLLECGSQTYKDHCFKQFAGTFPQYLKGKILDLKGNFVKNLKHKKGSQSSSDNNNKISTSTSSSSSELDVTVEEGIGKTLITRARVRLALQHATETKKANNHQIVLISIIVSLCLGFGVQFYSFFYFNGYFNNIRSSLVLLTNINDVRLYLFSSELTLFGYWGTTTGVAPTTESTKEAQEVDNTSESFFPTKQHDVSSMIFMDRCKTSYESMVKTIADMSTNFINVFEVANALFEKSTTCTFCNESGYPKYQQMMNLKSTLIYLLSMILVIVPDPKHDQWFSNNSYYCSAISTLYDIGYPMRDIRTTIYAKILQDSKSSNKEITINMYLVPIAYFVIVFLITLISFLKYRSELIYFMKMLHGIPDEAKKEASGYLIKDADEGNDTLNKEEGTYHNEKETFFIVLFILILVVFIGAAILLIFMYKNIQTYNFKFQSLNKWTTDSRIRSSLVIELNLWIYIAAVMKNPYLNRTDFLTIPKLLSILNTAYTSLDSSSKSLYMDSSEATSIYGVDSRIDELMLQDICTPNSTTASYHEMYRCGSSQQLINFYLNTILETMSTIDEFTTGILDDEISSQLLHMVSTHIVPRLIMIDNRLSEIQDIFLKEYSNNHAIYLICCLVLSIIAFAFELYFVKILTNFYEVILIFFRRISPLAIIGKEDLLNYLLDKTNGENNSIMSVDQNIIFSSSDNIICVSTNLLIEILNPAVSRGLGYTPEQLLGQSVLALFGADSQDLVETQTRLMLEKQSALTYEGHVKCIADDDSVTPCAITILAIEEESNIASFVIILRDESELLNQQNEAEKRKKESESLLYQILPRDIVVRLNQGEKDISFTVPSASIMFVDIVKFSEYSSSLTPTEIMGNLSLIFCQFDEAIVRFPLLLKIKLIGDVYMVAGGLFTPDEQPAVHAEQMIRFGLECLQLLEETNVKLNAVLNVRIGINTGGPLIAGVLGTDKPTFDIIGDPINIASRLQSTDIPSHIQISQGTYELVNNMDFQIEPRGEIYLKGKGNMPTYILTVNKGYLFQVSSSDQEINKDNEQQQQQQQQQQALIV